jgi:signal transduction histidine kinase
VANALAYPGFAIVGFLFTRFVRNLASAADQARQRVAELERERSRAITHDLLPFLRLDHFSDADEQTRTLLVQQAQEKYRQMRAFVDGTDNPGDLDSHLRAVVALHPQLATRAVFDIERQAHLEPEVLEHLIRAVDTALANVAQNAPEAAVVVTAVSGRDEVTVTVHDDGPGFDLTQVELGFGITQILGRQLEEVGGKGTVTSKPGKGTEVTIVLPREGP